MDKRIKEIMARLAGVTPGAWEHKNVLGAQVVEDEDGVSIAQTDGQFHEDEANMELMAHAPADLTYLIGELAKWEAYHTDMDCQAVIAKDILLAEQAAVIKELYNLLGLFRDKSGELWVRQQAHFMLPDDFSLTTIEVLPAPPEKPHD